MEQFRNGCARLQRSACHAAIGQLVLTG